MLWRIYMHTTVPDCNSSFWSYFHTVSNSLLYCFLFCHCTNGNVTATSLMMLATITSDVVRLHDSWYLASVASTSTPSILPSNLKASLSIPANDRGNCLWSCLLQRHNYGVCRSCRSYQRTVELCTCELPPAVSGIDEVSWRWLHGASVYFSDTESHWNGLQHWMSYIRRPRTTSGPSVTCLVNDLPFP